MPEIDRLEIQIEAQASNANRQLDIMATKLEKVSQSLSTINSSGLSTFAVSVQKFALAAKQLEKVKSADFTRTVENIKKISNLNTSQIYQAASSMTTLSKSLSGLNGVSQSSIRVAELAKDLSKLGGANIQKAIINIPQLASSLNNLMVTLSKSPKVSKNVIQMTKALANFASQGGKVGIAAKSISKNLQLSSQNSQKFENILRKISSVCSSVSSSIKSLGKSFLSYNNSVSKATKHTTSLAAAIGKFYASAFLLIRAVKALGKSVSSSMDFLETVNYFEVAMRQIGDSASSEWAKNGYNSAESYAESFSERSKQLTEKMTGYSIDQKGNAVFSGEKSLGLDPDKVMQYQAVFAQMSNSIGVTQESALNFSKALTMLGADWASLRNISFDQAWEKFASALAGQSRAVRSLGIDITMATLQQYAYKYGLSESVSEMNQATKAQLRLLAILDQSKVAYGDLANTISSPANQLRLLQQNFANLARTIGNLFLPVVAKILPYINGLVIALQRFFQWIGAILGIKMDSFNSSIGGMDDGLSDLVGDSDDLGDSFGDADKEAKKLKNTILGFDQLNVMNDKDKNKDEDKKPGMGGLPILDSAIAKALADYEKIWNDAFDRMENKAQEIADNIQAFMKKLFYPLMEAWDRQGKFVMDAWRGALESIGSLVLTIGKDFMTVLSQEKTVKIFEDIFRIIGDIGLIVDNLTSNFKKAWSENQVGLHILENIRDLFGIITENIREAADKAVEWSKNLNFTPLLEAFERFTDSLKPVVDFLSGVLMDFLNQVLLPLGEWVITKGLPDLLDVFTAFNERVDWEGLRQRLSEFWEHLEPFAETVGEGLVLFIERIADGLAGFIESGAFDKFLTKIEEWMDNVDAEDVADAFEFIAKAFIILKGSILAFKVVEPVFKVLGKIASFFITVKDNVVPVVDGILKSIGAFVGKFSEFGGKLVNFVGKFDFGKIFGSLNPGMIGEFGLTIERFLQGSFLDTSTWSGIPGKINDAINGLIDTVMQGLGAGLFQIFQDTFNWDATLSLFDSAKENFSKGGLYIIQGIFEGILGAIGLIVEPIGDFFLGLWNAICEVFGIHSPAESMKPLGENILFGIIEGFSSKISDFYMAIQNWFETSVKPWFTLERWVEIWNSVKTAFLEKWNEILEWWNSSALVVWWNEHVIPWFEESNWLNLFSVISDTIESVWNSLVSWWKSSGLYKWWNEDVVPWFKENDWLDLLKSIPSAFSTVFEEVFTSVTGKMKSLYDDIMSWVGKIIEGIGKVISKISEAKQKKESSSSSTGYSSSGSKKNITIPTIKLPTISIPKIKIPKFNTGGFPEDGLFMANHNELVGKFSNGKTAVANNDQIITGIKQGVYEAVTSAMVATSGNRSESIPYIINAVLKTEDNEVLARSVEKGKLSRDMRFQPVIT